MHTLLFAGLTLMSNGAQAQPPQPKAAVAADWVIDRCRITYKGHPVPVGARLEEFTKLFGPASDSTVEPCDAPSYKSQVTYYWDPIGVTARPTSDADPEKLKIVEISFVEAFSSKSFLPFRFAKGAGTIEFKPYGRMDTSSVKRILSQGFGHQFALPSEQMPHIELELGDGTSLSLAPLRDDNFSLFGLRIRYSPDATSKYQSYPEAFAVLDGSCLLPGAGVKQTQKKTDDMKAGLEASKRLSKAGAKKVADKLLESLGFGKPKAK